MLLRKGSKFLLCRPHKFGKSLLVSQLESFFLAEISLFENLQIWKDLPVFSPDKFPNKVWGDSDLHPFPVIRLDLSGIMPESLESDLMEQLTSIGKHYSREITGHDVPSAPESLVSSLACMDSNHHKQVVVLVDDYDSPIMSSIEWGREKSTASNRNVQILAAFFARLKKLDTKIRFKFVTGVSKVAHKLLFAGATDIQVKSPIHYLFAQFFFIV